MSHGDPSLNRRKQQIFLERERRRLDDKDATSEEDQLQALGFSRSQWVLDPRTSRYSKWNRVYLVALVYVAIVTPFEVCGSSPRHPVV